MIGSPVINKEISRILSPALKENGFTKVNTRHNWAWTNNCIWVLEVSAVGKYFSDVTGWPPMSIHVELGIYYDFVPPKEGDIKVGSKGELLPKLHQCQLQSELNRNLDQSYYLNNLINPAEKERYDLWWVEPDDSNVEEVVVDIKQSFLKVGLEWFRKNSQIELALNEIEKEHNGFNKFYKAKYFAERLNDIDKLHMYTHLMEQELKRIGR